SSGTRRDQARQLVRDLETRGSRAFPLFLESLRESGYSIKFAPVLSVTDSPVDIGKQSQDIVPSYPVERPNNSPSPTPDNGYLKPRPPDRTRRDSLQCYKMDSSPSGHCLIINNAEFEPGSELSDRKGSNIDCDKLKRRFMALNFTVEVKTNLKQKVRLFFFFY
ncbi:hypothetical protein XENOCAPTIV_010354, partial [Xenoophorus captivus]